MLAAFMLAKYGYRPLILERGCEVGQRARDIELFWGKGEFNPDSNFQFGEGGAGTFSDGKLTTRVQDVRTAEVLDIFIAAGTPPEIKYLHKPHIGTDKLREVVKNIRTRIITYGGEIEFSAKVTDVIIKNSQLSAVVVNDSKVIPCQAVFLATGHSARDTYTMLHKRQIAMEAKAFAIGVRIEHPQQLIDRAQYGEMADYAKLGPADYALIHHDKKTLRTAYSFCMCPGGVVVNGMSLHARASGIANSALVVNVNPGDYGDGILAGVEFQRHYEKLAFAAGGANYYAPVQTVGKFIADKDGSKFLTAPTYKPGTKNAKLQDCLPGFVIDTLGVETRTSAPVRLVRNEKYISVNTDGMYPIGEGAGYAGGIMSAALDGVNAAIKFINTYKPW